VDKMKRLPTYREMEERRRRAWGEAEWCVMAACAASVIAAATLGRWPW